MLALLEGLQLFLGLRQVSSQLLGATGQPLRGAAGHRLSLLEVIFDVCLRVGVGHLCRQRGIAGLKTDADQLGFGCRRNTEATAIAIQDLVLWKSLLWWRLSRLLVLFC